MEEASMHAEIPSEAEPKAAWNKGRLIGQKRPLKPKDVGAIRVRLQLEQRKRELALFNLAIDSKLRGCDLVSLLVSDVCITGRVRDRHRDSEENEQTGPVRNHRTDPSIDPRLACQRQRAEWTVPFS